MDKKRILTFFLFILTYFMLNNNTYLVAIAQSDNSNIVEDSFSYFSNDEKRMIEEEIKKLPENYNIIVLPTVHGSIGSSTKAFFKHRKLSQDTILILLLTDDKQIYAMTGDVLAKKGLNESFFQQKIQDYFVPNAKDEPVSLALVNLMQGISSDIRKHLVREKNQNSLKIPMPPENTTDNKVIEEKSWYEVKAGYYVGGAILILVLVFFLAKYFASKKISP